MDVVPGNADRLGTRPEDRAERSLRLVADEEDGRISAREVAQQMVADATAITHTRASEDDGAGDAIDAPGFGDATGNLIRG